MVHTFSKDINSNVNVIAKLEFELFYYNVTVEHVSHNAKGIPSQVGLTDNEKNKKLRRDI